MPSCNSACAVAVLRYIYSLLICGKMLKHILAIILGAALLSACSNRDSECVVAPKIHKPVEVQWLSLADTLAALTSKQQLVDILSLDPVMRDYFFQRPYYPNDSAFINTLYNRFTHPYIDTLLLEVHRVFGDEQALRESFQQAFSNLRHYYPDARIPRIVTLISGLETDMFVTDSIIYISLDYYLGPGARYRPNVYNYMLRHYTPDTVVPSVMLLTGISEPYNLNNPKDKTVLADMIAFGKAYYFAKHMLPCVPDSVLLGYTAEELEGARENAQLIWYRLVENEVLYATSHLVKQKYLDPRPKTTEISDRCPGRIGQWVGWEIVKSYMKRHPQTTLPELMQMRDADRLFKESGYRPVK